MKGNVQLLALGLFVTGVVSCTFDTHGVGAFPPDSGSTEFEDSGGGGGSGGGFADSGSAGFGNSSAGSGGVHDASDAKGEGGSGGFSNACDHEPCGPNTICEEEGGVVSCTCLDGFEEDPMETGCIDIDECARNIHDCDSKAICTNVPGSFQCTCHHGLIGDGTTCRYPESCADLAREMPSLPDGQYVIDPDGPGPVGEQSVFCDMTSDGGVGYTMVRYESPKLLAHQDAYRETCAAHGLELVVPRTLAHARSLVGWLGSPPNLVGVYPKKNGDKGLEKFEGRCQGLPCTFYMSDTNRSDCLNDEPSGNNNTAHGLYRRDNSTECGFWGRWDDDQHKVAIQGWVVCSTNDAGPKEPRESCQAYMASESVWNKGEHGISGPYRVDPDGAGPRVESEPWCEHRRDGGGWTLAFVKNSKHDGMIDSFCAADENLAVLGQLPESLSSENTARYGWFDLNDFSFDAMRLMAYDNGNETYASDPFPRAELRIPFGSSGYFLFGNPSGYYWCAGNKAFTDDGIGQVSQPPSAPNDCKGHDTLGAGWDFSESLLKNLGLTLCGSDGDGWMSAEYDGKTYSRGQKGAAQAIWVR